MEQGLIGKSPKYNPFFLFTGITFIISSLTYLIYVFGYYFIDWNTYMNSILPHILLNIVPGLLFFLALIIFSLFLFSGRNKNYISIFSVILMLLSAIWLILLIINSVNNMVNTLASISNSEDVIMLILNALSLASQFITIFTVLSILICFGILLICHLIQKRNAARIFIWIFPKIAAIITILLAVLNSLFYNIQLALISLAYPVNDIASFDDWLYEFNRYLDTNSTLSVEFHFFSFIIISVGIFMLSCGLNYHSKGVRPKVTVGTKLKEF